MDTHPEKLVPCSEGWPPLGAEGDLELLPEEEVFEKQVMPAAKSPRYDGEQKPDKFEHQVRITDRPLGWGPTLTFGPARPLALLQTRSDFHLALLLLLGSLPGVVLGSRLSVLAPERLTRMAVTVAVWSLALKVA